MHCPIYTMVICQHWQVKAVDVCSAIFDWKGKNGSYFCQLRLIRSSIRPASNQTQRWSSAVRSHLFEWILAFIWMNYWEREREREREMKVVCMNCLHLCIFLYKQWRCEFSFFKNILTSLCAPECFCVHTAWSPISMCVCVCVRQLNQSWPNG